jgi:hypothetical protein
MVGWKNKGVLMANKVTVQVLGGQPQVVDGVQTIKDPSALPRVPFGMPPANGSGNSYSHTVTISNPDYDEDDLDSEETIPLHLYGPIGDFDEGPINNGADFYEDLDGDCYDEDGESL